MQHKGVTAAVIAAVAGGFAMAPAQAGREEVCDNLDGLWSDRSEFIQITGRAACELTPETLGGSLLQLQFEYPSDVANDPEASQQLTSYVRTRIQHYQEQIAGDRSEIAVGVTYDEQSAGSARTVVFTESAFTKGVREPVTQKLAQTFSLSAPPVVVVHPDNSEPVPPEGSAPGAAVPAPTAPEGSAPGAAVPAPTAPDTATPDANAPEANAPETNTPETNTPDANTPETATPSPGFPLPR